MRDKRILPALMLQLTAGGCFYAAAALFCILGDGVGRLYPLILFPFAAAAWIVNRLLLRKESSVTLLAVANALLCGATIIGVVLHEGFNSFFAALFALIFCAALCVLSTELILHGTERDESLLACDTAALLFVLLLTVVSWKRESTLLLIPAEISLALALAGLSVSGAGRGSLAPAALGIAAAVGLMAVLLPPAVSAGRSVEAVWSVVWNAARAAVRALGRFLNMLAELFELPDVPYEAMEAFAPMSEGIEETLGAPPDMQKAAVIVIIALLLAAAAWALLAMRREHVHRDTVSAASPRRRARRPGGLLREALRRCGERVRLRLYLYRHRNEPYALFYRVERSLRRTPLHRQLSETPARYLARVGAALDISAMTARLIPEVNAALYAPAGGCAPFPEAAALRKALRRRKI